MTQRRAISRVGVVIVGGSLLLFAAVVVPALLSVRRSALASDCKSNLRQIAIGLHAYHDKYGTFPPAHVLGPDDTPWHSWRVLILPFLGEQKLYEDYHFDEPWNGPHNEALLKRMPDLFACPDSDQRAEGVTSYLAVVGRAAAFPHHIPVRLSDFHDGASNTIMLVESEDAGIRWTEPRDMPHLNAVERDAGPPPHFSRQHDGWHIATADGTVRRITPDINAETLKKLLTSNSGRAPPGMPVLLDDLANLPPLPPIRPASELPGTEVVAFPSGSLTAGRNVIYCASMAIAWDELKRVAGDQPVELSDAPPLAEGLNQYVFDRRNLAESSYVARAGTVDGGLIGEIREELDRKFPNALPSLLDRVQPGAGQLLIYTYLQKNLPFEEKFDVLPDPLPFQAGNGTTTVVSFGIREFVDDGPRASMLKSQVTILDYAHDDDFIIEFHTRAPHDRMILAKIEPGASLAETIAKAQRRIASPDPAHHARELHSRETLAVPRLALGVERNFHELIGHDFLNPTLAGNFVADAVQTIQFRLDETGAVLVSEVEILGENGHEPSQPGQRNFLFDRPFLLYLIQKDADQAYFGAWIENAELMEPMERKE